MNVLLSPLTDFMDMILQYFIDIWGFLLFIGGSAAVVIVLIGVIMKGVQVKVNKLTGGQLIMGGIIPATLQTGALRITAPSLTTPPQSTPQPTTCLPLITSCMLPTQAQERLHRLLSRQRNARMVERLS